LWFEGAPAAPQQNSSVARAGNSAIESGARVLYGQHNSERGRSGSRRQLPRRHGDMAEHMRITALTSQRRHPGRANLHIDGEFHCGIASEVVYAERLRVGDDVTPELLQRLTRADDCWRATDAALSLLATRARARRELADRLRRKGFDTASVDHALERADRLGLIDDRSFAEAWVRDRLRLRPRGTRALVAELTAKGVALAVARSAVADVMRTERMDDAELCRRAAEKWLRAEANRGAGADRDAQRRSERRLSAYLMRRGYAPAGISAALAAARAAGG
jgi:regulatory protein